jgi:hypothetical protein
MVIVRNSCEYGVVADIPTITDLFQIQTDFFMQTRFPFLLVLIPVISLPLMKAYSDSPESASDGERTKRSIKTLTPADTTRALEFATEHHTELAILLERLRESSPNQFRNGIREVHRAIARLDRIRDKQPTQFPSELQLWKTDSRIRLMLARWTMSQAPELEKQIRGLLNKRQTVRIERLETEHARAEKRLQQLEKQLIEARKVTAVDREWKRLQSRSGTRTKRKRSKAIPPASDKRTSTGKAVQAD